MLEAKIVKTGRGPKIAGTRITDRVLQDRPYAHQVAERLLEKLIAIDDFRGTGRIYVP